MPEAPYGRVQPLAHLHHPRRLDAAVTPEDLRVAPRRPRDIEARPTWKPMHQQPVFQDCPSRLDGTSDTLFRTGLCLPERQLAHATTTRTGSSPPILERVEAGA